MATLKEKTKKKEYTWHSCFSTNTLQLTSNSLTVLVCFVFLKQYITSTTGALMLFVCGSFFLPTHVTEQTFGFVMR